MFDFSMIQTIRKYGHKLDLQIRKELVQLYRPFRWIPCFMHSLLESWVKKIRKYRVIIEFSREEGGLANGISEIHKIANNHFRCSVNHQFDCVSCCSAT